MTTDDWTRVLLAAGVKPGTTERWAPVFARTIKPGTFSKGDAELPDFLATVLHESALLEKLKEDGRYSAERIRELGMRSPVGSRWRSLVPQADALAYNADAFFEACYGGRMGNDEPGDGARYPGRGLIGVTGKDNYRWLGEQSGQDLLVSPQLLEQPHFALELSIDWWEGKIPDSILGDEHRIRRIVNGDTFGIYKIEALLAMINGALQA
jgi:putative chitinase